MTSDDFCGPPSTSRPVDTTPKVDIQELGIYLLHQVLFVETHTFEWTTFSLALLS